VSAALESAAVVALMRLGRRSPREYAELLDQSGSALALMRAELAPAGDQVSLLPEDPEPLVQRARADVDRWRQDGFALVTVLDPAYPVNLRQVHDRPPLLFVAGKLVARDARSIALIGSRRASRSGLEAARSLAESLSSAGFVIVSGLAEGIDTMAHEAALDSSGRTVAVIGTGLARTFPPQNAELQRRIVSEGAVISQFWPDERARGETFRLRNALMSGLALGTVIVEASARSGTRVQARAALAHGRPVFLLRGVLGQEWATELARRPGVHVIDGPDEIIATVERLHGVDTLVE
jgi:DNA processing protein